MRQLYIIFFILTLQLNQFGQVKDNSSFNKGSFLWGLGLGQKTHLGNVGITFNYYAIKNFSIKTSLGFGFLNYNGGTISIGPEYTAKLNEKLFCYIGTVYLLSSSTTASIETHQNDVPTYHIHAGAQYVRPYLGFGIRIKENLFKFEFGYSYITNKPTYWTSGQWDAKYDDWISKGLGSGISWGFTYQLGFFK